MHIEKAAAFCCMLVSAGCSSTSHIGDQPAENPDKLSGRTTIFIAELMQAALHQYECAIGIFMDGSEQVGTVFKTKIDDKSYAYITAGHNLPYGKTKNLSLQFNCNGKKEIRKITNAEKLSGIDVALLRLDDDIDGMIELPPGEVAGLEIDIPNYSYLEDFDKSLKWAIVPARGRVISEKDGRIFFTSDVIKPGASGAPIINRLGKVIGVVTGRYLEKNGSYSGVGNGYTIQQVLRAIAVRGGSGNSERVR